MVATAAAWHGTEREAEVLRRAIARNCTCEVDPSSGATTRPCPPHEALVHDQRFVDGLVFARRVAMRWKRGEWVVRNA